jgi:hypothetical protein
MSFLDSYKKAKDSTKPEVEKIEDIAKETVPPQYEAVVAITNVKNEIDKLIDLSNRKFQTIESNNKVIADIQACITKLTEEKKNADDLVLQLKLAITSLGDKEKNKPTI